MQVATPSYYQTILNSCNGNRACVNLIADWAQMDQCEYTLSDYVELFYRCVTGKQPLTLDMCEKIDFANYILSS